MSLRYLKNSYTWDGLLKHIAHEIKGDNRFYFDIKSSCAVGNKYQYEKIAQKLESELTRYLTSEGRDELKIINDKFYELMDRNENVSRLKIYISNLLSGIDTKPEMDGEISELKKTRKNVGSIITTNYDKFIETVFQFDPLIGNNILLSNPYGSVYKIHGCVKDPAKIIITEKDYEEFDKRYELIRAQLLSIFIHNPIIFLGYSVTDNNIKSILKTIFSYVEPNSEIAKNIRNNFLLVEFEAGSVNHEISDHDIDIEGYSTTIRINKIKTDDFSAIYRAISSLNLPVSAMDIRKVQSIVKEIYAGGKIQVKITDDLDSLSNSEKILAIGSVNTIKYEYQTSSEMIKNYFNIIDEENHQLISLIDKMVIPTRNFFPIFGFNKINKNLKKAGSLREQQIKLLKYTKNSMASSCKNKNTSIADIMQNNKIPKGSKDSAIIFATLSRQLSLDEVERYLRIEKISTTETSYRKLVCAYDAVKYSNEEI
ncbi:MAG: hypothetical protein RLY71_88 [Pseudomonadota bacterium]